jgi:uncharacterized protein YeaO (DUF488 family)
MTTELDIRLKRAYEEPSEGDGTRILVDRIWPRGVARDDAALDDWFRDVAPSDELRTWFGHEPSRWREFRRRYWEELDEMPEPVERLEGLARKGRLTLVYGARDEEHNNARALKEYLERASAAVRPMGE